MRPSKPSHFHKLAEAYLQHATGEQFRECFTPRELVQLLDIMNDQSRTVKEVEDIIEAKFGSPYKEFVRGTHAYIVAGSMFKYFVDNVLWQEAEYGTE